EHDRARLHSARRASRGERLHQVGHRDVAPQPPGRADVHGHDLAARARASHELREGLVGAPKPRRRPERHERDVGDLRQGAQGTLAIMSGPAVSIVVPTRDRADYLRVALDSLAAQDFAEPYETIVVDDASREPVEREGVRVVRRDSPSGPNAARNAGIATA